MSDFIGYFGLGLVNSLHCLGMCSPIVITYSSRFSVSEQAVSPRRGIAVHLLYNFGRITTYSFLGGVAGLLGKSLDLSLLTLGLGKSHSAILLVTGFIVMLFGLMQFGALRRWTFLTENLFFKSSLFQNAVTQLMTNDALVAKWLMGVALGFLPCILTYSMLVTAVSSDGFFEGFMMLLAFGVGTIPMLLLTGILSSAVARNLKNYGNQISGTAMLILSAFLLFRATAH